MSREHRVHKVETQGTQTGLPAALTGWSDPVDSQHPDLRAGPDENGHALISPYWAVWFLDGTKQEQEEQLKLHRGDPRYQNPPAETNLGKLFVRYINGASFDGVMCKIDQRREAKRISETQGAE